MNSRMLLLEPVDKNIQNQNWRLGDFLDTVEVASFGQPVILGLNDIEGYARKMLYLVHGALTRILGLPKLPVCLLFPEFGQNGTQLVEFVVVAVHGIFGAK